MQQPPSAAFCARCVGTLLSHYMLALLRSNRLPHPVARVRAPSARIKEISSSNKSLASSYRLPKSSVKKLTDAAGDKSRKKAASYTASTSRICFGAIFEVLSSDMIVSRL